MKTDEQLESIRAARIDRRTFLLAASASVAAVSAARWLDGASVAAAQTTAASQPVRTNAMQRRAMARFPEKTDLILLTDRPPQLETPIHFFRQDLTPNDAFFVRWHLSAIPTSVDLRTFRLSIGGHVDRPVQLSLDQLRRDFEPVSLIAVAQCSGNSRSFFQPRVPGGQWGNGAVGNARWTGVPLRALLDRAGLKAGAVDVSFAGLDRPPMPDLSPFVKSLEIDHARDGEVMVAYAMNDAPLPMLNGFPLRLVVPGWFATYWVKSLDQITVLPERFHGFWMDKAYRIPNNPEGNESPQQLATDTVPISRHTVRSLFVRPEADERMGVGQTVPFEGLAFDAGDGIARVEVSTDAGGSWSDATLDRDLGRYSWRRWRFDWKPATTGKFTLMCRATNVKGVGQTTSLWNRSGYQRNVIERMDVTVS